MEPRHQNQPRKSTSSFGRTPLGLEVGRSFGYWFDFGDDWWHQINVEAIEEKVPGGKFPRVTKRVGKSPPQYAQEDE